MQGKTSQKRQDRKKREKEQNKDKARQNKKTRHEDPTSSFAVSTTITTSPG